MTNTPEYAIQNFKVFVPVKDGVIIFDIRFPDTKRFIANSFYDAEYPTLHTVEEAIDASNELLHAHRKHIISQAKSPLGNRESARSIMQRCRQNLWL